MGIKSLVLCLAMLFATKVWGTISITGIAGVSGFTKVDTPVTTTPGSTTPTGGSTSSAAIFGGLASGSGNFCTTQDGGERNTCNNCLTSVTTACINTSPGVDQFPLCACSPKQIYSELIIQISIKSSDTTGTMAAQVGTTALTTISKSNTLIEFKWKDVCAVMTTPGADCTTLPNGNSVTVNICMEKSGAVNGLCETGEETIPVTIKLIKPGADHNIYAAPTTEGIGGFVPFPGDGKIYITQLKTPPNFPAMSGAGTKALSARVFVAETSMLDAHFQADPKVQPTDLPVATDGNTLTSQAVKDLVNERLYFFRLAMIDEANNILQYFPDMASLGPECTTAPSSACIYSATPSEVLGLLTKDFNCFVATAAYGSPLEPKLEIFREFRSRILLRHNWGKHLILMYYKYGPYAARYISERPFVQSLARGMLWPAWGFSWMALKFGLPQTLVLTAFLLLTLITLPWFALRRWKVRV